MTEQRHPDIEIYVKNCSLDAIEQWLQSLGGTLERVSVQGGVHAYRLATDGALIPVLVHEKVVGKAWTSVWFNSDKTAWANDLACAQQAADALDTQVRCIASGWNDGDDPDEWWKVENGQHEIIQWQTH